MSTKHLRTIAITTMIKVIVEMVAAAMAEEAAMIITTMITIQGEAIVAAATIKLGMITTETTQERAGEILGD